MGYLVVFGVGGALGFVLARWLVRIDYGFRSRADQVSLECSRQFAGSLTSRIRELEADASSLRASAEFYRDSYQRAAGPPPLINSRGPRCWN